MAPVKDKAPVTGVKDTHYPDLEFKVTPKPMAKPKTSGFLKLLGAGSAIGALAMLLTATDTAHVLTENEMNGCIKSVYRRLLEHEWSMHTSEEEFMEMVHRSWDNMLNVVKPTTYEDYNSHVEWMAELEGEYLTGIYHNLSRQKHLTPAHIGSWMMDYTMRQKLDQIYVSSDANTTRIVHVPTKNELVVKRDGPESVKIYFYPCIDGNADGDPTVSLDQSISQLYTMFSKPWSNLVDNTEIYPTRSLMLDSNHKIKTGLYEYDQKYIDWYTEAWYKTIYGQPAANYEQYERFMSLARLHRRLRFVPKTWEDFYQIVDNWASDPDHLTKPPEMPEYHRTVVYDGTAQHVSHRKVYTAALASEAQRLDPSITTSDFQAQAQRAWVGYRLSEGPRTVTWGDLYDFFRTWKYQKPAQPADPYAELKEACDAAAQITEIPVTISLGTAPVVDKLNSPDEGHASQAKLAEDIQTIKAHVESVKPPEVAPVLGQIDKKRTFSFYGGTDTRLKVAGETMGTVQTFSFSYDAKAKEFDVEMRVTLMDKSINGIAEYLNNKEIELIAANEYGNKLDILKGIMQVDHIDAGITVDDLLWEARVYGKVKDIPIPQAHVVAVFEPTKKEMTSFAGVDISSVVSPKPDAVTTSIINDYAEKHGPFTKQYLSWVKSNVSWIAQNPALPYEIDDFKYFPDAKVYRTWIRCIDHPEISGELVLDPNMDEGSALAALYNSARSVIPILLGELHHAQRSGPRELTDYPNPIQRFIEFVVENPPDDLKDFRFVQWYEPDNWFIEHIPTRRSVELTLKPIPDSPHQSWYWQLTGPDRTVTERDLDSYGSLYRLLVMEDLELPTVDKQLLKETNNA